MIWLVNNMISKSQCDCLNLNQPLGWNLLIGAYVNLKLIHMSPCHWSMYQHQALPHVDIWLVHVSTPDLATCQHQTLPRVSTWPCHMSTNNISTVPFLLHVCLQHQQAISFPYDVCLTSFKLRWKDLDELFDMDTSLAEFETIWLDRLWRSSWIN